MSTNPINSSSKAIESPFVTIKKKFQKTPKASKQKTPKEFWQNIGVGGASGMFAVIAIQPMIYFKNIAQSEAGQYAMNPRIWYRGCGGFAASFIPTMMLQKAGDEVYSAVMDPISSATAAGVTSAVIVGPSEMIMIQQQKTGKGFWETAKIIYKTQGYLHGFNRAIVPTSIREGIFSGAFLGVTSEIKEGVESMGVKGLPAQITAGVISGTIAACTSHPFDTYKTKKQSDFSMKTPMMKFIFQKNAWAGIKWRLPMVATAITVMSIVGENLNAKIEEFKK